MSTSVINQGVMAQGVFISINVSQTAEKQEAKQKNKPKKERQSKKAIPISDELSVSTSPTPKQNKGLAIKEVDEEISFLESALAELHIRLKAVKEKKLELENESSSSEDELPKFKGDGSLDKRFGISKKIARSDGGLDRRYKVSKNAIKLGIATPDGLLPIQ
jgi:hypothetical protein